MAHRRWTDEDLLEHLRTWLADGGSGRIADYRAWAAGRDAPADAVVSSRLGGWRHAIAATGVAIPQRQRPTLEVSDLVRRYEEGATTAELAREEGVDPTTIRRRLARSGAEYSSRPGARVRYPLLHDEAWIRTRYVEDRVPSTTLAREIGCHESSVLHALIRFGIARRRPGPAAPRRSSQ